MAEVAFPVHLLFVFPLFIFVVCVTLLTSTVPMNVAPVILLLCYFCLQHIVNAYYLLDGVFWQLNDSVLRIVSG